MTSMIERDVTVTAPDDIVLSVNNVSKKFCRDLKRSLFYGVQDIASEILGMREKNDTLRPKEFWALNDVSFQLRRGEALGLVGKNGSGKSTLLRVIAGLIRPDTGFVEVNGRVAPLIALGAGFNPVLTGRENIYANMAILGLSKQEIDDRFDEVVEFAEIGDAIDSPVQSYSSGMAARLGFASAIHTEPEIILIDEVLAVGDIKFRSKCYRKLDELRKKKISFVMVSHDPEAIYAVCENAYYIKNGVPVTSGSVEFVMREYQKDLFGDFEFSNTKANKSLTQTNKKKNDELEVISAYFRERNRNHTDSPTSGEYTDLCLNIRSYKFLSNLCVRVLIRNGIGDVLFIDSLKDRWCLDLDPGMHEVRLAMPHLGLNPGSYTMNIWVLSGKLHVIDFVSDFNFKVELNENISTSIRSQFYQPRSWSIQSHINSI